MSTRFKGFALLAILVSATGVMPVFASPATLNATNVNPLGNTSPTPSYTAITVTTDKPSYNDGDKITISGSARDYISDTPVVVLIRNPIGNVVYAGQIDMATDKTYSVAITAGGSLWQAAGTYDIHVQFGSKDRTADTTFEFAGSTGGGTAGNTIKVEGTDYSVKYSITNGKVLGMKVDTLSKSLIVSIQSTGDGVLTITLPRGLIDAKVNGQDEVYIVLVDGQETDFQETNTTDTDRTLSIPFTYGNEEIEIVGTFVIPEFGPIAALVLVIAIISIIAISAKTGLRLMPRY